MVDEGDDDCSSFHEEAAGEAAQLILLVPEDSGKSKAGSRTHEQVHEGNDSCQQLPRRSSGGSDLTDAGGTWGGGQSKGQAGSRTHHHHHVTH
jgi:hypothetical protein